MFKLILVLFTLFCISCAENEIEKKPSSDKELVQEEKKECGCDCEWLFQLHEKKTLDIIEKSDLIKFFYFFHKVDDGFFSMEDTLVTSAHSMNDFVMWQLHGNKIALYRGGYLIKKKISSKQANQLDSLFVDIDKKREENPSLLDLTYGYVFVWNGFNKSYNINSKKDFETMKMRNLEEFLDKLMIPEKCFRMLPSNYRYYYNDYSYAEGHYVFYNIKDGSIEYKFTKDLKNPFYDDEPKEKTFADSLINFIKCSQKGAQKDKKFDWNNL